MSSSVARCSGLRWLPHTIASSVLTKAGMIRFRIRFNRARSEIEIATFPAVSMSQVAIASLLLRIGVIIRTSHFAQKGKGRHRRGRSTLRLLNYQATADSNNRLMIFQSAHTAHKFVKQAKQLA